VRFPDTYRAALHDESVVAIDEADKQATQVFDIKFLLFIKDWLID